MKDTKQIIDMTKKACGLGLVKKASAKMSSPMKKLKIWMLNTLLVAIYW